jgi:hypothetical protein
MSGRRTSVDNKTNEQRSVPAAGSSNNFSLVPLLLTGQSISPEARRALRENRLNDAAAILMDEYGLSCTEAGDLLNVVAC